MTFADKLAAMERDLVSIANRMNIDASYHVAEKALVAIRAVNAISNEAGGWLNDLDWKWKPKRPERVR